MKDEEQKPDEASESAGVDGAEAAEASDMATEAGDPQARIAELEAEVAQYRDAALRARAEAENVRRRAERDIENAHKYALEKFAGQLLPVADSLDKSVEAAASLHDDAPGAEALREGVELSRRLFLDTLERAGIEQLDPVGDAFDPNLHEAMSMVDAPDATPNNVVHVLQKGYTLNGRLLRAAMVTVAKGPG